MSVPSNLLMPNGRAWSSSSVDAYIRCPTAWWARYGPREASAAPAHLDGVARRRGRVLHTALCEALRHADIELRRTRAPINGTLRRYYTPARRALGLAWVQEGMPSDSDEAARVVDMFERALDEITIPRPGTLHGIERQHEHVTRGGVPVVFIPDVTWWVTRGRVLRVRDYKSGKIDEADVPRHQQLLRYAGWLGEADPRITAFEIELYSLREARGYMVPADPEMIHRAVERFDRIAIEAMTSRAADARRCGRCATCVSTREDAA